MNEEQRSYIMSKIKSKGTKPEIAVRKFLHTKGFRFRLHNTKLPGKPDIILPKYKAVIFVHGCFWHGHTGCKYYVVPKTRTDWWLEKINTNIANDLKAMKALKEDDWKIIVIHECDIKPKTITKTLTRLLTKLSN